MIVVMMMMVVMLVLLVVMVMMVVMLVLLMVMVVVVIVVVLMLPVVMIMVVMMLMLLVIMVFMVVVMMVMVVIMIVVVVMAVLLVVGSLLGGQTGQLFLQGVLVLHGLQDLLAVQLLPGGGDDGGVGVVLPQQLHGVQQLLFGHASSAAEDDGGSVLNLVVEELAEVLHIDLALGGVGHGDEGVELDVLAVHPLDCADDVGQLAHAGGLNEDAVGLELEEHLLQSLAEVAHQAAADAAGIHLGDLHPGVLQEAAVDANFAELIFDQNQLFPLVGLLNQLFDEGGLTGP